MKRFVSLLASLLILLPFFRLPDAGAVGFPYKNKLNSESALLISLDTNEVLTEKNADTPQCPGPLVNIMTAVIVLENCKDLNEQLTLDPEVYTPVYYEIPVPEDLPHVEISDHDELTIKDLLYCMMLTSSIEASETLADHFGKQFMSSEDGSVERPSTIFVKKMNEKAQELGLTSTKFTNAHGMHDPEQYTTARDLAKLTEYALNVPHFREIATAATYQPAVPNATRHPNRDKWIWNHSNLMMDDQDPDNQYYFMGAKGIKTSNLEAAGRSIVTIASKNGYNYLAVLLKAPFKTDDGESRFCHLDDAANLLNWAFQHFSKQELLAATAEMGEKPVKLADNGGKNYVIARPKESVERLWCDEVDTSLINKDKIIWYKDEFQAPVKSGDALGSVTLVYAGEELATVELVAVSDVERSKTKYNIEVAKRFHKSEWFRNAVKISIILCIVYIIICIYALIIFKSNKKPLKPIYAVPKLDKKKKKKKRPNNTRMNKQ